MLVITKMEATMNKHEIFIGLNDKDAKTQVISTEDAMLKVHSLVGDCSMSIIQGYFTHADGSMVVEKTIKCEVFNMEDEKIHAIVGQLKLDLNQESILVNKYIGQVEFI